MTVLTVPQQARRTPARGWTGEAGRLPADLWRAFLSDPETVARYHAQVYRRGTGRCWPWTGSLSSSGHGRLRCGTRALDPGRPASRVVVSHEFGYMLSRGILPADPVTGLLPVIRHSPCDEAGCHNPVHWVPGTALDNSADYWGRRQDPRSPLQDSRGPRGRAVAIRDAIRAGLAVGATGGEIEAAIQAAGSAGIHGGQGALF